MTKTITLKAWQASAAAQNRLSLIAVPIRPQPGIDDSIIRRAERLLVGRLRDGEGAWREITNAFRVGDVLIGLEAWAIKDCGNKVEIVAGEYTLKHRLQYPATDEAPAKTLGGKPYWWNRRSARSMPEWASRFRFTVKSIAAKRLPDLDELQALDLGIEGKVITGTMKEAGKPPRTGEWIDGSARDAFFEQWDRDYPAFPFASSPWIWLVGVERIGGAV